MLSYYILGITFSAMIIGLTYSNECLYKRINNLEDRLETLKRLQYFRD